MAYQHVPSSPYDCSHEADVVCEAIESNCRMTVRSALVEAYRAGVAEGNASLIAQRDALLTALKGLRQFALGDMDECDEACEPGCLFCAAKAAIELAEGGQ